MPWAEVPCNDASGASLMVSIIGPSTYLFHKQPLPLHIHQHHLHHASPTHLPWSVRCCCLECSQVAIATYNHWWYIAVWDIAGITITTYNWLLFCYLKLIGLPPPKLMTCLKIWIFHTCKGQQTINYKQSMCTRQTYLVSCHAQEAS